MLLRNVYEVIACNQIDRNCRTQMKGFKPSEGEPNLLQWLECPARRLLIRIRSLCILSLFAPNLRQINLGVITHNYYTLVLSSLKRTILSYLLTPHAFLTLLNVSLLNFQVLVQLQEKDLSNSKYNIILAEWRDMF